MADLKAGTTVGGNTIWSQANLPLLPAGNSITYKGFKVYTENDKPTKAEIGLGNVTNDAQVKKSGDEMTGNLTLLNGTTLTVPLRVNIISDSSAAPYLLATRSDNNAITQPFPSVETRVYSLLVNTKSNTSEPSGGATLAAQLFNQKPSGAGTTALQVMGAPNKTTGASGSLAAQVYLNGEIGSVELTGSSLTIGMQTTINANLIASQLISKGAGNRNISMQDANGVELSLLYADTGKNFYVRTGGSYTTRFSADGTLLLANNLSVPGTASVNGFSQFNNRVAVVYAPDWSTFPTSSSMLRVDTSKDGNAVGDGITHFGYKDLDGNTSHYFRGTGTLNINTVRGINATVPLSQNDVPQGTPAQTFLSSGTQGGKNYLRRFRGGADDTIWHETIQEGTYRLATGATDVQEELIVGSSSTAGYIRGRNEIQSNSCRAGGNFRAVEGNYGVIHRNDGSNYYTLITNSGDPYGTWGPLRPTSINLTTGYVSFGNGILVNGVSIGGASDLGLNSITFGDADSGIVGAGDGIMDLYANNQRVARWTTGATTVYKQSQIQGVSGPALLVNGIATNQSCYLLIQRAGTDSGYLGFPGTDANMIFHNYLSNTNVQLRSADVYANRDFTSAGNGNFNDVYIRSDIRLKSNLVELKDALDKVEQLKGYMYDKQVVIADETEYHREAGLIAQDVQKVLPESVKEDTNTGMLTISPAGINALLVTAINEIRERLEVIENKLGV